MVKAEETVEKPSKEGSTVLLVVKEEDTDKFPSRENFQAMIHKEKR